MKCGRGQKIRARCARNHVSGPPNLQHLPTPMFMGLVHTTGTPHDHIIFRNIENHSVGK